MTTVIYYNNDVGTFFILLILWILSFCLLCYIVRDLSKLDRYVLILSITFVSLSYIYIDNFRWFKTEHLYTEITLKKTFSHDTRNIETGFTFKDDGIKIYNYQTGHNIHYLTSEKNEIFKIKTNLVPKFMSIYEPGKKINIKSWKLHISNGCYEIYYLDNFT